jgi:carnitine O-acetyltransferase
MALRTFTKPSSVEKRLSCLAKNNMPSKEEKPEHNSHPRASVQRNTQKSSGTFDFQEQLPNLPIPDLEATCQKYLDALRPLQDSKEHHESRIAVKDFLI